MKIRAQILAVLIAITMIGSAIAAIQVPQQASAQGVIVPEKGFEDLSKQFQTDVSKLVSSDPPSEDTARQLAELFDNYEQETFRIFELEPPDPDLEPPTPDLEPPDPDATSSNLKEPGKIEVPN